MSHIEEGATRLVFVGVPALLGQQAALEHHPCIKLMRQALSMVAKQYAGEVKPYYYNFNMQEQPANTGLALHIPVSAARSERHALPRGIGVMVDAQTGAVTFRGDPWMVDKAFYRQVQALIVQRYTALAQAAALRQMGYQVSLQQQAEGQIHVAGVSHA